MTELLNIKRTAHIGTYRVVPKVAWQTLSAANFTAEGGGEVDWLALYPVKPLKEGAPEEELPQAEGVMSPRQAGKLFYDAVYLLEQSEKNPKFLMDKLPEMCHKSFKRKQFQKQFLEACKRVACRLAKGKGFYCNCVAEDMFVIVVLEATFAMGWRRIESHLEGLPECQNDRDFSKIKRVLSSGEVEMLWRGADAVVSMKKSDKKADKKAAPKTDADITDPQNWFKGYDTAKDHLLDHVIIAPDINQSTTVKLVDAVIDSLPVMYEDLLAEAESSSCAIVITEAETPFRIDHVNTAWSTMCGFQLDEVKGREMTMIQGPETDVKKLENLVEKASMGKDCRVELINYKKDGTKFRNHLRIKPLASRAGANYMLGVLTVL